MSIKRWQKILAPAFLSVLLLVSACGSESPPSAYDQVQQETSGAKAPAVSGDAIQGSSFNALFPDAAGGFDVVPSQEKKGFAEYKLKKEGTTMAMLSINDTISNPDAAAKFANSDRTVAGYPAVDISSKQTAILVADRFQVKVQSKDEAFAKSDREDWLGKFNLRGLASLQAQSRRRLPPSTPSSKAKVPTLAPAG